MWCRFVDKDGCDLNSYLIHKWCLSCWSACHFGRITFVWKHLRRKTTMICLEAYKSTFTATSPKKLPHAKTSDHNSYTSEINLSLRESDGNKIDMGAPSNLLSCYFFFGDKLPPVSVWNWIGGSLFLGLFTYASHVKRYEGEVCPVWNINNKTAESSKATEPAPWNLLSWFILDLLTIEKKSMFCFLCRKLSQCL